MELDAKIYVAGHTGLVGSAIIRQLKKNGYHNLIYRSIEQLNLINQNEVSDFFSREKPEYVILAAAKVGGILANKTKKADFIYQNLQIQNNVIHQAYINQAKKLLFLGSSCIYPRLCPQPMKEEHLLSGYLEESNDAYAIAKIAGLKMCQAYNQQYQTQFISAMPTNLYGYHDNFDLHDSHVLPALMRKFHEAKMNKKPEVVVWGTGRPQREFLFVDDLAEALIFLINHYQADQTINVGTGTDITIKELALLMADTVGYPGRIHFDTTKPDGTPRKLLDVSRINQLGWQAQTSLEQGLKLTYQWYIENENQLKK